MDKNPKNLWHPFLNTSAKDPFPPFTKRVRSKLHPNADSFQVMTGQTEGAAFGGYGNGGCFFGTLCSGPTGGVIGYSFSRPDHHYDENGNIKPEWRGLKFSYPPYASNSAADLLSLPRSPLR